MDEDDIQLEGNGMKTLVWNQGKPDGGIFD